MKTLIALATLTFGLSAYATGPTHLFTCYGKDGRDSYVMTITGGPVADGGRAVHRVKITSCDGVVFDADVTVEKEDVMQSYRSRRGAEQTLSGMVYLDELNETYMDVDGEEIQFDCN